MYYKGNRMVWIPALFGLLILISGSTAIGAASPQLPCEFYGPVTISGSPAPVGTVITAYVNSVQQGKIVVKEAGKYGGTGTFDERLIVLAAENDFTGGAPTITFKIGDKVADQTAPYSPGMSTELSMSSGGGAAAAGASASVQNVSAAAPKVSSIQSVPVSSATPVVPVITAAPTPAVSVPVATPAVPVITAAPVPVVTTPVIPVATTTVPQGNPVALNTSAPIPINQTPANQTSQSAPSGTPSGAPVVPVVTTPPVPVITAAVPQPVNQTVTNNTTNATAVPVPAVPVVSFPSGQIVTK